LQIKNTTVKNHKYRLVFMASKETNDSCYIVTAFDKNRVQPAAPPRPEAIQVETIVTKYSLELLDPDPYRDPDSVNPDPQLCFIGIIFDLPYYLL
jgi:hypothetical protein